EGVERHPLVAGGEVPLAAAERLRTLEEELSGDGRVALEGTGGGVEGEAHAGGGGRDRDRLRDRVTHRHGDRAEDRAPPQDVEEVPRAAHARDGEESEQDGGAREQPASHAGPRRPTIFHSPSCLARMPLVRTSRRIRRPEPPSTNTSSRVKVATASLPSTSTSMLERRTSRSPALSK